MAKKSMFGLGTLFAAVTGVVAGAVGMFLSDEDNRKKVAKEVKHVGSEVKKDIRILKGKVKTASSKLASKKKAKRKSR